MKCLSQLMIQRRRRAMRTSRYRQPVTNFFRTGLEHLEQRLAPAGLINGDFSVSNPADPGYGWTTRGNASISNGVGVLDEGTTVETEFSQTFTIPTGTQILRFTIAAADLVSNGPNNPPDAFEAALLNATTMAPLVGPPTGLSNTDSFLNIQQTGQVYYAPQVTVPGAGASGAVATLDYPEVISVDVSSVPANTQATLYFDLIGFSPATSSAEISDVVTLQSTTAPTANPQSVTTAEGTAQTITLTGADPNIPPLPLTYNVTTQPTHGTLSGTSPNLTYTPAAGYFGADSFTFTDSNGSETSSPATVSINVVGTPTANAQSVTTAEGAAQTVTLTGADPNSPPLALTYSVTTQPTHGTLSGTAPDLTYTPTAGYFGADSFAFTDNNGTATSTAATVSINVVGTPTANSQSLGTGENTAVAVTLTGSDPNTPPLPLTYTITTSPLHGTLSGTAPNLTYTPTAGYTGADSFQFTDTNGVATSSPATVTIAVGTPIANPQSITTAEGTAKAITLTGVDSNTPPLPLTYSVATQPAHGTLSGTAPDLTYTPESNYFGADSFTFTDSNGTQTSSPATVSIDIVGTPTANAQSVTTAEGAAQTVTLTGSDPNTPPLALTYTITTQPTHGTLSGTAPDLTYTPTAGYFGADSFAFTDSNGTATSTAATVSINVVGTPTANSQSLGTGENLALAVTLTGSDPNSPPLPLTFTVTTSPLHGTLSGTAPNLTYTPTAGYTGADSFQFTDTNGVATSSPATITIAVGTPIANPQSITTAEGTAKAITLTGVDSNTPPLPLTYSVTTQPTHGTLSGTAPNLTYTPTAGYFGADSFTFTDSNGTQTSSPATVSISVVGTPTANAQSVTTAEGTAQTIILTGSDPNTPPLTLTYSVTTQPTHGTLSGSSPNLTYTPTAGYFGADSFAFTDNNGTATSAAATVSINVVGTPTANSQSLATGENTAVAVTLTGSDPNSPALPLTFTVTTNPLHGTLSGTAPNLTYTPTAGYTGADRFQFTDTNGVATSSPATVTFAVGVPIANPQSITTAEGTAKAITLTGVDSNTPPLPLTYSVTTQPTHGTLSGTAPDLTYTPTAGYFGADSFTFTDSNGLQTSSPATVSISVVGTPTANAQSITTAEGTAQTVTLTGSDPNTPPLALTYSVTTQPTHGTLSGTAPNLTYTPTAGYFGPDSFAFTDNNGTATSPAATVSINVVGTPTANSETVTVTEGTAAAVTLGGTDPNTPPLPLTFSITTNPLHGTLAGTAPNLTYTPAAGYMGTDSFAFRTSNGTASSNTATVSLVVTTASTPSLVSAASSYSTIENRVLTVGAPGVLANLVSGGVSTPVTAVLVSGPAHGSLVLNANGSFTYTPAAGFHGSDSFTFQAVAGTVFGNVAEVHLTVAPAPLQLLPYTRYFNYVRYRRSIDPARFDTWHPRIGAIIAMERNGIPTTPTTLVSVNHHFAVRPLRALYQRNPARFDSMAPVLGALFQLESPVNGTSPSHLLPLTPHYNALRVQYNKNPVGFDRRVSAYLGALFEIEDYDNGVASPLATHESSQTLTKAQVGSTHPGANGPLRVR